MSHDKGLAKKIVETLYLMYASGGTCIAGALDLIFKVGHGLKEFRQVL